MTLRYVSPGAPEPPDDASKRLGRTTLTLRWVPQQSTAAEWMDAPGQGRAMIVDNLKDLRRVNRLLGGVYLTLAPLLDLLCDLPPAERARVLDVATGGGDIPRAVRRAFAARGRSLWLVASDISEAFVSVAREQSADDPGIAFVVADGRHLPFGAAAFHVATCSLALHHLAPPEARLMLAEMGRCATRGVVVNDIVRRWIGYAGAILATRLGSANVLTRHDGPLSVLRAYTRGEMEHLAHAAGLQPQRWRSFLFYRVAMTALPPGTTDDTDPVAVPAAASSSHAPGTPGALSRAA